MSISILTLNLLFAQNIKFLNQETEIPNQVLKTTQRYEGVSVDLNKEIEDISETQKKALALKWGYIKDKELFFDKGLLINILIVGSITLLFLIYLSILNKRLKRAKMSLKEINFTLEKRIKDEVEKSRERELIMLNQSRLAQMGQVLNMVAHQWRQPLNNLLLINEILVFKYNKKQERITKNEMESFQKESTLQIQQMSKTIDDFRNFFQPRKEKSSFSLNGVILDLLTIVKPIFTASEIKLIFRRRENIYIFGYPNELTQAILNILYNAKDAHIQQQQKDKNKDKRVAKVVEIRLKVEEKRAILTIKNNAGSINNDIILHIFDPYFSTKKSQKGTGLGLYMSKMIIEKHMNGKLFVKNIDNGVVFQIELMSNSIKPLSI